MSNSSLASPVRSSVSTTAMVGENTNAAASASASASLSLAVDAYNFPTDLSMQDKKEEALQVLKSELMAELNKQVKSLDEDNWMFEGPRSRIHVISKPGGLQHQRLEIQRSRNLAVHK